MKNEILIRSFEVFESEVIFTLMRRIYLSSGFMSDDFDRKFPDISAYNNFYKELLQQKGSFVLIATCGQKPCGYIQIEANPATRLRHRASLNMGVAGNFRKMGIGSLLIESALNKAIRENQIEIMYLMVRADHKAAISLYKKFGFDLLAVLEKDTKIGNEYFDGVLMRKFLP